MLLQLFLVFLRIGPMTFGGGYSMIPLIEREIVERKQWLTTREIANIFAVSESVPGAIGINSATFIGYRLAGVKGAIAALIGVLLPTFTIVLILSTFFLQVQHHPKVEAAFEAIRATIVALIAYAAVKIGKTAVVDITTIVLIVITVTLLFLSHLHPILWIVGGGLVGVGIIALKKRLGMKIKINAEDGSP